MIPALSAELIGLLLGSFGRSSPMDGRTQILFGVLVVGISLVGLAVMALGFKSAAATQRRFADELEARRAEITDQEGDPRIPASAHAEPGAAGLTLKLGGSQRPWPYLRTCSAPALAILRARCSAKLDLGKPYLAASLFRRLGEQPGALAPAGYSMLFWEAASAPACQGLRVDMSGKGFSERWTLVRAHSPIQCHSCGGSVSGELGAQCPTCHTPCTGFEAGWRALDIAAA
jgi:hypothetical protein